MMSTTKTLVAALSLFAIFASVHADEPLSSHDRMRERLQEIDREHQDVPLYGPASLKLARQEFDQARAKKDIIAMLHAIHRVGRELTLIGRPDKALETLAVADPIFASLRGKVHPAKLAEFEAKYFLAKGVAALRKAENENCVHCQEGEGCLFPISGKGIHIRKEGSTLAAEYLKQTLSFEPDNLTAIWLLNIAHMTLGTFPDGVPELYRIPKERLTASTDFPRFRNIALPMGLDTLSLSGGVIAEDFDGDHDTDIMVSEWSTKGQIRFFRNMGDGTFEDQTEASNLNGIFGGLNLVQADYDNDGDEDVLVLRGAWLRQYGFHPNSLLQNDGNGVFTDVTFDVGLAGEDSDGNSLDFPTQTGAWADYDNDGDLDLLVGNEAHPNQLFENDGAGSFRDVAAVKGLSGKAFTKAVAWADIDGDGFPEWYESNYMAPNRLFKNEGGKSFSEITQQAGVANPKASFAVWFWDYNNDGQLDLYCPGYLEGIENVTADYFVPDAEGTYDALYEGKGDGTFQSVGLQRGFVNATQTMGCNFGDLNNDGFLDIYLGTGYPAVEGLMPNVMYLNQAGKNFADVSIPGGFSHLQKGHAIAFADFDNDGDQDVFAELGGAYAGDGFQNALFENPGFGNHSIKLRLIGEKSNRNAIGARVRLTFRDGEPAKTRSVYRWISSGSSFGSHSFRQEIGVGSAIKVDEIEVYWPTSKHTQVFRDVEVDQYYVVDEFAEALKPISIKATTFDSE
ncbi:CRTAC1 family protein [Rubripirellula amarantea]|nr:CRTAC1 family protein [Rubripirellula amarantea]